MCYFIEHGIAYISPRLALTYLYLLLCSYNDENNTRGELQDNLWIICQEKNIDDMARVTKFIH